jgi:hypothetical protein
MFIPMIAAVVMILVIVAYMSSSQIVTSAAEVKMSFEKTKFAYSIEKVIVDATENLCQKSPATCKNKEVSGVITLTFNDLIGYIPDNFDNSNMLGGSYGDIQIVNGYTTVRLTSNVDSPTARKVYLSHYRGKEFGISPQCVAGLTTSSPPCTTTGVYHDFPTSLETRAALE